MQACCTRDVVMALVLATGFALTGCVSGSHSASDAILPPDERAYSESKQTSEDVELQRLTRELTPTASASRPDDVPNTEHEYIIRQPPNKAGLVVPCQQQC